jgi:methionine-rich copper-binding protein CopC
MKTTLDLTLLIPLLAAAVAAGDLKPEFLDPPDAARPGVYWYFMDGNQDRDEMIADLRAMKKVGIGSVLFLEVNIGIPRGPIPFMSEKWQDNIAHSFVEAGKLGMEVILGTGPGWSGSGGSWVRAEDSMQHLVGGTVQVKGPGVLDQVLPVPPPHPPNHYSGMNPAHKAERDKWFRDVAVLAFPTPAGKAATIEQVNIKTLKDVLPYSIRHAKQTFVMPRADYPEPDPATVIDLGKVVDLTSSMQPDGSIRWTIPAGDWTVMRFVARSTGQTTRPAPRTGHGFECNKFDAASYRRHWDQFQAKLLERIVNKGGPLQPGKGLTTIHLDSWEMSSQNWTAEFRDEFRKRRGYDPQPFYPAWMGMVVGSLETTERFLWDMRRTSQELVLEQHAGEIKKVAHQHGLLYSNEPYDMNPAGDIDLGSVADIPMCEFWNHPHDTHYGCIEAVSAAHTMGPQIVKAEAFTSSGDAFAKNPANMKNQTDWAFAIGINGIVFHTYQHQALGSEEKPGMTMGPYGIQWHRNQTFWDFLPAYHEYLTRCSHLLRQGEAVADILYLTPEGAPHIFEEPADATDGAPPIRDKKGYSFDAVTPRILAMRAEVEEGRIAFPEGSQYRVLVLPDVPTMTPETLAVVERLVKAGATVIGNPPVESPSLVDHPACDAKVSALAKSIWGETKPPEKVTRIDHGSGAIFWGGELDQKSGLYPTYRATAAVLAGLGLAEDFSSPSGKLRFIHRRTDDCDVYFVSNRTGGKVVTEGHFRVQGRRPQLWDPVSGETRALGQYDVVHRVTRMPLTFEPYQSFFVVFPKDGGDEAKPDTPSENFPTFTRVSRLEGPWNVEFFPAKNDPQTIKFEQLVDWTTRPEEAIRYHSGVAAYRKLFDLPDLDLADDSRIHLDLGAVHDQCMVRLNGKNLGFVWTAPWRVDITSAVKPSGNRLEILVANGWVNRLIGDQQPGNKNVRQVSWPSGLLEGKTYPAGRHTYVTRNFYKASSTLMPAGLVGPVSVMASGPDTFAPKTSGLRPADNETMSYAPASLMMTFDEPIKAGTGTITIRNLGDSSELEIAATDKVQVSIDGRILTISPTADFLPQKNYAVRIAPTAITDLAGNPFAGIADDTSWNFTTGESSAQVIVHDGFSGSFVRGNGAMSGRVPDSVNLTGRTYTEQQNINDHARMELDSSTGHPGPSLKTGFNNSAHIQWCTGTPRHPVTLSIDAQVNSLVDDADPRGIGLGFWSQPPTLFPDTEVSSTTRFTGIVVNPAGTLEYVREGKSRGTFTKPPAGFSPGDFLTLSYTVDPATKAILKLEFAGTDHTADFLAKFPADFTAGTPSFHSMSTW